MPLYVCLTLAGGCDCSEKEKQVEAPVAIKKIAVGLQHTLIVKQDGSLIGFGDNRYGQLGLGDDVDNSNTPVIIYAGGVEDVAASEYHTLILKTDGSLWACGSNSNGQLGDNSTTTRTTPVTVNGMGSGVTAISAGKYHSLILKTDGSLWACGSNSYGQLGDETNVERHVPVQISGIDGNIALIETGAWHSLAVTTDGKLYAWGINQSGQIGNDDYSNVNEPLLVLSENVADASAGQAYTLILMQDGKLLGCGENNHGQLCSYPDKTATPVELMSDVSSMSAGGWTGFAIKTDGSVKAWGYGLWGQLGNGTNTENQTSPVTVSGLTASDGAVFGGGYHVVVLKSDSSLWLWGLAQFGELGDGQGDNTGTENRNLPWNLVL